MGILIYLRLNTPILYVKTELCFYIPLPFDPLPSLPPDVYLIGRNVEQRRALCILLTKLVLYVQDKVLVTASSTISRRNTLARRYLL